MRNLPFIVRMEKQCLRLAFSVEEQAYAGNISLMCCRNRDCSKFILNKTEEICTCMARGHVWYTLCFPYFRSQKFKGDVSYLSFPLENLWKKNLSMYVGEGEDYACVGMWGLCMCGRAGMMYVWVCEDYAWIERLGPCVCGRAGTMYVWRCEDYVYMCSVGRQFQNERSH